MVSPQIQIQRNLKDYQQWQPVYNLANARPDAGNGTP